MTCVFSVDVEDYFQAEAFSDVVDRDRWDGYPCRVERNTKALLDLLDAHEVRGTFFILGWVADRYPALVREIVARGHEPACHSYWHRLIYMLDRPAFEADTRRAKDAVEQAAGERVFGYRAPSYSITGRSLWALDVLAAQGFTYDSSIFPIHHDVYGIPAAPRAPVVVQTSAGAIREIPLTTFRVAGGHNLPVGGGGYLRILPFWYTRLGVRRALSEGLPLIAYVHPWEIDPDQPRLPGRMRSRFRHYTHLSKMRHRLGRLLALARFSSFRASGLATCAGFTAAPRAS